MASSEPPYIPIGTDVSAKYKGAFCEAKVKKIVKCVKCRVYVKELQSTIQVPDDNITGTLKLGMGVEVKHPDSGNVMEGLIKHINDSSMYTVVFDDADERTLRRTQLVLKGDKHFMESETLDNLPLSNPEHFGTPVIAKGKRRTNPDDSDIESDETTDEEGSPRRKIYRGKNQELVGKVKFYDSGEKKKSQQLPVLVVLPGSHPMELKTKDHLLVRSFKDGKFVSVMRKELIMFTREAVIKNEDKSLKPAMEKALLFVDNRELPPNWNKTELIGSDDEDDDGDSTDDDDNEISEEKDRFVAQLYKFSDDRGTPINKGPSVGSKDLNLYKLFKVVKKLGGYNRVTNQMKWRLVYSKMQLPPSNTASTQIKNAYKKYLHAFEDFYRKLGSSMGTISRPVRNQNDSGRSIMSFRGRESAGKTAVEKVVDSDKEKGGEDSRSGFESDVETGSKQGTPKRAKSARIKLDLKDAKDDKNDKEDIKEKIEPKKEEKKEKEQKKEENTVTTKKTPVTKKQEKAKAETPVSKKPEKKEEPKIEVPEKKVVKKKEETTPKVKKDAGEEKELKELQKKIVRRRSARNDEKGEEEVEDVVKKEEPVIVKKEKEEPVKKDKKEEQKEKKKEEKEEEKKKDGTEEIDEKTVKATKKKKAPVKKTENSDDEEDTGSTSAPPPSSAANTHDLPVGSKLKIKYGRGRQSSVYEAKILEVGTEPGVKSYFVHYQGWNNRHDEWVKPERIVRVLERPDSKKKGPQKPSPKPTPAIKQKKKLSNDKAPASPSSVKSDGSNHAPTKTKGSKSPHTSSPASASSGSAKVRPTRSNSVDVKIEGLPARRRARKTSTCTHDSVNDSESEESDKSDDEMEVDKKPEEKKSTRESPTKLTSMPSIANQKEEADIDTTAERSPPQLSKVTDIAKEKAESDDVEDKCLELDKSDVEIKEEPVAPVLKVIDLEKNSEPILQKIEAQLQQSSLPAKIASVTETKEPEVKKKEPEKRAKKAKASEDVESGKKTENKDVTAPSESAVVEESPFEFKEEREKNEVKVREKRKPAAVQEKESKQENVNVEEEKPVKKEVVKEVEEVVSKDESKEVVEEKTDKAEKLLSDKIETGSAYSMSPKHLFEDFNTAKSDSEIERIERRGRKKKLSSKEDMPEIKKFKLQVEEKPVESVVESFTPEKKSISEPSERKPFFTLAEKKQGFSPIVRKMPNVTVEKNLGKTEDNDSAKIEVPKPESEPTRESELKEEVKKVPDIIVVHKESPVKSETVMCKKTEESDEVSDKNMEVTESKEDSKDESTNESQNVKKKVRKKAKKKVEAEEQESAKKVVKARAPSVRVKENQKKSKDSGAVNKDTTDCVEDNPDIDLRCDEDICSRSGSPETVSDVNAAVDESQGFAPLIEAMECRLKESQQQQQPAMSTASENKDDSVKPNVFENTPPTTPEHDSDESSQQETNSEQVKNTGKSNREVCSKVDSSRPVGSESPVGNASPSNHSTGSSSGVVAGSEGSDVPVPQTKRRRESDEPTPTKRRKRASRGKSATTRSKLLAESDSEEASNQSSMKGRSPFHMSDSYPTKSSGNTRTSPRPPKFNFNLEEGKYLEGTARITFLIDKIQEIRTMYTNLKTEVACIDRRRKRLRKRQMDCATSSAVEVETS